MKLLIVESPSKAKTIEKYLDGGSAPKADKFTVRASVGHIRDLPKSNKKAIDIEGGFIPHYEISKGKEKVVHELQALAEKANGIILATDPDREGEAIAWHIETLLNQDKKVKAPIERVAFHEITKEAIEEALKQPRKIDTNLRKAQEARRVRPLRPYLEKSPLRTLRRARPVPGPPHNHGTRAGNPRFYSGKILENSGLV